MDINYFEQNIKGIINVNKYKKIIEDPQVKMRSRILHYEIYNFVENQWINKQYNIFRSVQGIYYIKDDFIKINKYLYVYDLKNVINQDYYIKYIVHNNFYEFCIYKYNEVVGCSHFLQSNNQFTINDINYKLKQNNLIININILNDIINYVNSQILLMKV